MNETVSNTVHGTNFQLSNCGTDLYCRQLTWVRLYNEVTCLFILVTTSIATTGTRSDIPTEHAQYQGWNIGGGGGGGGDGISKNIPLLQSNLIGPFYMPM